MNLNEYLYVFVENLLFLFLLKLLFKFLVFFLKKDQLMENKFSINRNSCNFE